MQQDGRDLARPKNICNFNLKIPRGLPRGEIPLKYWDASALLPLLVEEPSSKQLKLILAEDPSVVSCWGSVVECYSALWRRKRENVLEENDFAKIKERCDRLFQEIDLVSPTTPLRDRALRLLGIHPLRSGAVLQLAAALRWAEEVPKGNGFVSLDRKLREAAKKEGFLVLPATLTN